VHGFLGILAIFRALYELSIAYNIILYNILDVFQETLFIMPLLVFVSPSVRFALINKGGSIAFVSSFSTVAITNRFKQ
jgi:hypothetical protein